MKNATRYTLLTMVAALCSSCRIDVAIEGEGEVSSPNETFTCTGQGGDCEQTYTEPGTETLVAKAAPGYRFSRWRGCDYRDITSCTTEISQSAVDNENRWTITAQFEPVDPEIQAAKYTYNALGQRITKTVNGVTTIFQYDLQGRLIAELDSSGQPLREHIHLKDEPVAQVTTSPNGKKAVHYVHSDHLGSPVLLTDDAGKIRWDRAATPFGETHINYAEIEYNRRFPGQYYDGESALHYNYFRDYDPLLGRYVQADPIGLYGGLNTYSYAAGNPLSAIDPYGLWTLNVEGYFIVGGGIRLSYSDGTLELLGRLGLGFGAGASYDPLGTPTPHSKPCGNGHIATTSLQADGSIGIRPFALGGSYVTSTGNAITTPQGGGFQSFSLTNVAPNASPNIGFGIGASVGANIGSYTNW